MLSEDLRKRIAALNRRSLHHDTEEEEAGERLDVVRPGRRSRSRSVEKAPIAEPPGEVRVVASPGDARLRVSLDAVAEGVEVGSDAGCFLLIEKRLSELMPGSEGFRMRFAGALPSPQAERMHPDLCPLAEVGPDALLFVDIEATGLTAGSPLFLVGVVFDNGCDVVARQLLARDYSEEAALLAYFSEMLEATEVVVSFNGKSYDLPYIRDRSVFHSVPFRLRQHHLDLVHESRRRWKEQLPNCKLQTLERFICRRMRSGDIPGAEIPEAYHRFVRTGNAVQMRDILHHNALDLITMLEILVFMLEGREL